jgi:hypothetical protein
MTEQNINRGAAEETSGAPVTAEENNSPASPASLPRLLTSADVDWR